MALTPSRKFRRRYNLRWPTGFREPKVIWMTEAEMRALVRPRLWVILLAMPLGAVCGQLLWWWLGIGR